jgi:5'-nucleotidase
VGFGEAVVAFMNPGGIRADLTYLSSPAGEGDSNVTYGESFTVQPFGNSLVTMSLTGAQIETLLEQQFAPCTFTANRILQVSAGFSYTWNSAGGTCDKVDPSTIMINGVVVNSGDSYRVTVNSFLADGGDSFPVLKEGTDRLGGAVDTDALEDYFTAFSPVAPGPQNRITRIP